MPVPINPKITPEMVKLAKMVTADGLLKFSDPVDKQSIMVLVRILAEQADAVRPTRYAEFNVAYDWIVAGLKACDGAAGWQTVKAYPSETDEQRQIREDRIYGMLASLFLLARDGVRVGLLEGR